jgi:hypothetical protein
MNHTLAIVIAILAVAIILFVIWAELRRRRRVSLQARFGPEYERTVREIGSNRAESVLLDREKRVEKFNIRDLTVEERERFVTAWRTVQSRFVDAPQDAVREADLLVDRLMRMRGYPMSAFDQRAADISVDHPLVVDNYRAAHQIALRHRRGQATTEDLRNALIYYRSLFDELLQVTHAHPVTPAHRTREVA